MHNSAFVRAFHIPVTESARAHSYYSSKQVRKTGLLWLFPFWLFPFWYTLYSVKQCLILVIHYIVSKSVLYSLNMVLYALSVLFEVLRQRHDEGQRLDVLPQGSADRVLIRVLHPALQEVTESARAQSYYSVGRYSSSTFTMLAVRFGCAGVSWGVFDTF